MTMDPAQALAVVIGDVLNEIEPTAFTGDPAAVERVIIALCLSLGGALAFTVLTHTKEEAAALRGRCLDTIEDARETIMQSVIEGTVKH